MQLKICGIKYHEHLLVCLQNGVEYIGINFCKNSKRYAGNGDILQKINNHYEKSTTKYVAILKDNTQEELEKIVSLYNIDILQIYDDNLLDFAQKFKNQYEIWHAKSAEKLVNNSEKFQESAMLLIDSNNPGGGQKFSNNITEFTNKLGFNFGIAGGINAKNILQFKEKYPRAKLLDLASGVEENGEFSKKKMEEICVLFYNHGR